MKNIFTGVLLLAFSFLGLIVQVKAQTVVATADPNYVCYDGSSQLNAAHGGITGTISYSWTPTTGLNDTAISNPIASNLTETVIYTVEVTGNEGAFSDTTAITVYDELLASITADQTICYNTAPAPLTSNISGGEGTYSYQWFVFNDSNWSLISLATNSTYQPGELFETTLYRLAVNDGANCGPVITDSVTITVFDELLASITADQTICFNTLPDLLTSEVTGGDETYTYQWQDSPDGTTWTDIPGAISDTYQPPALSNTTYYQLIVDDEFCDPGISNTVIISVFNELLTTIDSNQTICFNAIPDILSSEVSGGDESYTYQWQDSPDGATWADILGATSDTYQPPELSSTKYFQLIVDDEICDPEISNTITITVFYELLASIESNQTICYNTVPDLLTSAVSGGDETYTYQWQESQYGTTWTDIPGAISNTYQPPALTSMTYYKLIVNDEYCIPIITDSILITVYDELLGSISSNDTICSDEFPNPLTSAVSGGDESYTYQWQKSPDGNTWTDIPDANSDSYQPPALNTTTYYHLIINDENCAPVTTNLLEIIVIPKVDAGVSISASPNPTCDNEIVEFTITDTINGGNNPDFEWFLNNESKSTEAGWSAIVSNNDEVYIQMNSSAKCLNDNPVNSDPINMTVYASPVLLNSGDLVPKPVYDPVVLICVDSSETNTYHWFENGEEIQSANEKFYYPGRYNLAFNFGSEYHVMLENEFCSASTNSYTYTIGKSGLFEELEIFIVYPNPNNGNFSLVLNEEVVPEDFESCTIRLLDVAGKLVFSDEIYEITKSLKLSGIQKGLYFLEVRMSESQHQVRKLIIE